MASEGSRTHSGRNVPFANVLLIACSVPAFSKDVLVLVHVPIAADKVSLTTPSHKFCKNGFHFSRQQSTGPRTATVGEVVKIVLPPFRGANKETAFRPQGRQLVLDLQNAGQNQLHHS